MAYQSSTAWGLDTVRERDWRVDSLCRDVDPETMWPLPENARAIEAAVKVCEGCPVKLKCLQDGEDADDWESVRAGYTGKERRKHFKAFLSPSEYPPPIRAKCDRCQRPVSAHSSKRFCPQCRADINSEAHSKRFVSRYLPLARQGLGPNAIAEQLGYLPSTLAKLVAKARKHGLLKQVTS